MPGLVDVHGHLELTILRGFLEDDDFFRWIRRLTRTKYELLSTEELEVSASWGLLEAIRSGVTTLGEVCDLGASVRPLIDSGIRAVVYQEVFGPDPAVAEVAFEGMQERVARHRRAVRDAGAEGRVRVGVSPHAPYTVSPALFRRVVDWVLAGDAARRDGPAGTCPVSIHAGESAAEGRFTREGRGPFADLLQSRGIDVPTSSGRSPVAWLDDLGVLATRPLLAHCVDSTPDEARRLAEAGATVAHCPISNAKLGHGVAPLGDLWEAGVRVGLGTDSVASGNVCDPLEELRVAAILARTHSPARPPRDWIRLATLGGAEALGMEEEIGTLEPGKRADLVAIDLEAPHVAPVHDVEAALVWSASGRDVALTWVGGRLLHDRDGRCGGVTAWPRGTARDRRSLARRVEEIARRLRESS